MSEVMEESPAPKPAVRRQKNMLVVHRLHAMQRIEGMEAGLRSSRWMTQLLCALLSLAVVWFLVQSIAGHLVYVDDSIVLTKAHVDGKKLIEVDPAPSPFIDVFEFFDHLSAGRFLLQEVLLHPLLWIAGLSLLTLLAWVIESRGGKKKHVSLEVADPQFSDHQSRFFANPFEKHQSTQGVGKDSEAVFGDDVPRNLRRLLSWWNAPSAPERSSLENGLIEVKRFLGEDGYLWLQCCAALPRPHWHIAVYIGRTMTNGKGEPLYNFEDADKLDSLPWFVSETMPIWLRKHLLAGVERGDQQELRRVLQALLISTSQGAKNDLALEITRQHPLFMRSQGNLLTQQILDSSPQNSELRDPLFQEFMERGVDDEFYADEVKVAQQAGQGVRSSDYARIVFMSRWISRVGWSVAGLVLVGIIVYLVFLSGYGGFKLSLNPPFGVITVEDRRQNPPAMFFWLSEGQKLIEVDSKDFRSHNLILEVQGRVIADLDSFGLIHMRRAGRLRELPDDPDTVVSEEPGAEGITEPAVEPIEPNEPLDGIEPETGTPLPAADAETPANGDATQDADGAGMEEENLDFNFEELNIPQEEEEQPADADPGEEIIREPGIEIELDLPVGETDAASLQMPLSPTAHNPPVLGDSPSRAGPEPGGDPKKRVAAENRSESSQQSTEGSERFSFAPDAGSPGSSREIPRETEKQPVEPLAEVAATAPEDRLTTTEPEGQPTQGPAESPLRALLEEAGAIRSQPLPAELSLKNLPQPGLEEALRDLKLDEGYSIVRRAEGIGLAMIPGTRPLRIQKVDEGLLVEIDDAFLRQVYRIRQIVPRNPSQAPENDPAVVDQ